VTEAYCRETFVSRDSSFARSSLAGKRASLECSAAPNRKQRLTLNVPLFYQHPSGFSLNPSELNLNMTRRLTNQDAFDDAMLHLLNQGHSCVSASGQARYRGARGMSAIGALIPDELYVTSMEGEKVHRWLTGRGLEHDALRARLGSVTPSLLDELEDLHNRIGACMPSLYRHLAVAGAQRIAHSFKLSMRLVHRCATYQHLRGPKITSTVVTLAIPAAPRAVEVAPAPDLAAAPTPAPAVALTPAPTPALTPIPTPAPESPQNDLDLFARGIARAIAASRGLDQRGS
jgi:hypothetical protein